MIAAGGLMFVLCVVQIAGEDGSYVQIPVEAPAGSAGFKCEATTLIISMVDDDTPCSKAGVFSGQTRDALITLARAVDSR